LATPDAASADENYQHGRDAFANGVGARQVPGYLSALDADAWMRGWQDASEAGKAGADPATGEITDIPDIFEEGRAARAKGAKRNQVPARYPEGSVQTTAWIGGWDAMNEETIAAATGER